MSRLEKKMSVEIFRNQTSITALRVNEIENGVTGKRVEDRILCTLTHKSKAIGSFKPMKEIKG